MSMLISGLLALLTFASGSQVRISTSSLFQYRHIDPNSIYLRPYDWIAFQVKTTHGVHVGLKTYFNSTSDMYEIVIDGWDNQKTAIRRAAMGTVKASINGHFLSASEFRSFWISWGAGVVSVGQGLQAGTNQLVTYTDPSPCTVNYLSVTSGTNSPGEWIFERPDEFCKKMEFELASNDVVFLTDARMLTRTKVSLTTRASCSVACYNVVWCQGFSYSTSQQTCIMFDTDPWGQSLSQSLGWETWSLIQ